MATKGGGGLGALGYVRGKCKLSTCSTVIGINEISTELTRVGGCGNGATNRVNRTNLGL